MSEATQQPTKPRYGEVDTFLQQLVALAETTEEHFTYPITLFVGGMVVTGELASHLTFLQAVRPMFSTGLHPLVAKELDRWVEKSIEAAAEVRAAANRPVEERRLIILRNARFLAGNGQLIAGVEGEMWWRGKLSAVDAFSMGVIAEIQPT